MRGNSNCIWHAGKQLWGGFPLPTAAIHLSLQMPLFFRHSRNCYSSVTAEAAHHLLLQILTYYICIFFCLFLAVVLLEHICNHIYVIQIALQIF